MTAAVEVMARDVLHRAAAPLEAEGLLDPADVAIVGELARLAGEHRAPVLIALALAVAAPRRGDVALDLGALASLVGDAGSALFEEASALVEALGSSPLVGAPGARPPAPFVLERGLLYTRRYFTHQARLAAAIRARAHDLAPAEGERATDEAKRVLDRLLPASSDGSTERQRLAVAVALRKRLVVVSGGPGTGKTFTIRTLLAVLLELAPLDGPRPRIALAAPTGKAAARITEAMGEGLDVLPVAEPLRAELAALRGQTIHRLLGVDARHASRFRHHALRPLPHDVVVVDEASMIDLPLFAKLVAALRPEARLVLLGDRHQLASVQAGAVLADLTGTRVPFAPRFSPAMAKALSTLGCGGVVEDARVSALEDCVVHLDRPRRFEHDGGLGRLARALAAGTEDALDGAVALLAGDASADVAATGLALVPHGATGGLAPEAIERLAAGFRPYLALLEAGPRRGEAHASFHLRVLAAFDAYRVLCVHRVGPFGAEALARELARFFLRDVSPSADPSSFWIGRPVLVTHNRYDLGRMNGDVGLVVRRADGAKVVAFADDAGRGVAYLRPERLPPHESALAMTVHKSQGSQFDRVALVLPDAASPLLTREIVYTAVTRARRGVEVYGDRAILRAALGREVRRASGLADMLWSPAREDAP